LLLHLVDIAPINPDINPADEVRKIATELGNFSEDLAAKPRWLVLNKIDLLRSDDVSKARQKLLDELAWEGPVFEVSAVSGEGSEALGQAIIRELESLT
jgi:GTP-binding protein